MSPPRSRPLVRFDVRAKLFLASVCVIAIAVLASYVYLSRSLETTITNRTRDDLFVRLEVVARDAENVPPDAGLARWDDLADDLGARAHVRVTFISAEGRVLGDSEVPRARIPSIENHRHRPEVEQAFASGRGSATRLSDTIHVRLLYVAAPMKNGAIARVALPLVEVERAEAAIRRSLLVASLLALVLAAIMSLVIAHFTSRAIGDSTHVANAMAHGDFDARAKLSGADELSDSRPRARPARRQPLGHDEAAPRRARPRRAHPLRHAGGRVAHRRVRPRGVPEPRAPSDAPARGRLRRQDTVRGHPQRRARGPRRGRARDERDAGRGARARRPQAAPPSRARRAARGGAHGALGRLRRRDRHSPTRVHAPRLRRQRVARAAHAGHRGSLRRRDAALRDGKRPRGRRTFPRDHRAQRRALAAPRRGSSRSFAHRVARVPARVRRARSRAARRARDRSLPRARREEAHPSHRRRLRRPRPCPRRPARLRAGADEPRRQRAEVFARARDGRRPRARHRATRQARDSSLGGRHRPRHRSAPLAAPVRAVLPRRHGALARARRNGARTLES